MLKAYHIQPQKSTGTSIMIRRLGVLGKQSDAPDAPLICASDFPKNFQAALSFHAWKHDVEPRHEYDGGNQQCRNKQFHATIVSVSGVVVK